MKTDFKALEDFKIIKLKTINAGYDYGYKVWDNVEQALLELKAIKEAKPSEAVECIDYIENKLGGLRVECERHHNHNCDDLLIQEHIFTTIKQALQRLEEIDNAIAICKKANEQKYVYIKESYGIIKEKFLDDLDYEVLNNRLYVNSRGIDYDFPLKDYGVWWALSKEELDNGN